MNSKMEVDQNVLANKKRDSLWQNNGKWMRDAFDAENGHKQRREQIESNPNITKKRDTVNKKYF